MKRVLQIAAGVVGVGVLIFLSTEVWVRTQSVIFLITMTCVFPFALIYLLTGGVIRRRRPLLAVGVLALVGGYGLLMAWGNQFNANGFSEVENGFIMNLSTEVVGAAVIVLLLSFSRAAGNVTLFFLALAGVLLIERTVGATQAVTLNLSTELLGSLLTTLVVYRFVEQFEHKAEKP